MSKLMIQVRAIDHKIDRMDQKLNNIESDLICPITLDFFEDPITVPCCGKCFSRNAIVTYIEQNPACPWCQKNPFDFGFDGEHQPTNRVVAGLVDTFRGGKPREVNNEPKWSLTVTPLSFKMPESKTMAELTLTVENASFQVRPAMFIAALDCSGSMSGNPERQVRAAVASILGMAKHNTNVRLVLLAYSDSCQQIHQPEEYKINGGTNFRAAFQQIDHVLANCDPSSISNVIIAFLTDGQDTCGGKDRLVPDFSEMLHRRWTGALSVHSVAFGNAFDRHVLEGIRTAGTQEGTFRFADSTDNDDLLCQKISQLFELCTRSSTVPVEIKSPFLGFNETINMPISATHHGEYRWWISLPHEPFDLSVARAEFQAVASAVTKPPNEFVDQRWISKIVGEISVSVIQLNQQNLSENLRELACALIQTSLDVLMTHSSDDSLTQRLKFTEQQLDQLRAGKQLDLNRLNDLRFSSLFGGSEKGPTPSANLSSIVSIPPPVRLALPCEKSYEDPLKKYSHNNENKKRTPLQQAIMSLQVEILPPEISTLIESSSLNDILHKDADGNNTLHLAAYSGMKKITAAILKKFSPTDILQLLEVLNDDGETAVTLAIKKRGFHQTLGVLLDAGAKIPRVKKMERFAIEHGFPLTAQVVGNFGDGSMDVDSSMTPTYVRFLYGRICKKSFDTVRFFEVALEKKLTDVALDLLDNHDVRPTVDQLIKFCMTEDLFDLFQTILTRFLPALVNEVSTCEEKDTLLTTASQKGLLKHVKFLVSVGAILDQTTAKGNTAFWIACFCESVDVMDYLMSCGADVNWKNLKGNSPLYGPCTRGSVAVAERLITYGADVLSVNTNGDTLLLICCRNNQAEVLKFLLNYVPREFAERVAHIDGFNALMASAEQDRAECIRVLFEYGFDLNQRTAADNKILSSATALHLCSYYGRLNAMKMLLQLGANPNLQDANGQTPVHIAVIQGSVIAIQTLRIAGADLDILDAHGNIPMAYCRDRSDVRRSLVSPVLDILMKFVRCGFSSEEEQASVRLLEQYAGIKGCLDSACVIDVCDFDKSTPLALAVIFGRIEMVKVLIRLGADPLRCNVYGMNSIHWALWMRNHRMLEILNPGKLPVELPSQLTSLGTLAKFMLFMGQVPPNYTHDTRSMISARMESFINTPQRISEVHIGQNEFSDFSDLSVTEWLNEVSVVSSKKNVAVEWIRSRVLDVQIFTLNKLARAPIGSLDPRALFVTALYTSNSWLCDIINESLLLRTNQPLATKVYNSLRQLNTYEGEVFIGSDTAHRTLFQKGTEFSWGHFVSGSTLWKVALENVPSFTTKSRRGIVFIVKSKTGRLAASHSSFSFDAEVVFFPTAKFKVTNWYHGGDVVVFGQENIREHTFGIKSYDEERLNLEQMMNNDKSLVIELTEMI